MLRLRLAALFVLVTTPAAQAVLMESGKSEADYRALGASMAGKLLSLNTQSQSVTGHGSAVYLNSQYAITAAHSLLNVNLVLPEDLALEFGTGRNYLSDPGTVVQGANILIYPSYDGTFYTPDIAIVRFATPLAGPEIHLGSVNVDDFVVAAGFGRPGFPGSSTLSQDGFSRGWQAQVGAYAEIGVNPDYYNPARFGAYSIPLTLNGRGTNGDSGGPWFNSAGELVGMTVASSGGTSTIGNTDFLDLSNPEVQAWILANTVVPNAHPGDFNADRVVDASDYVVWRESAGTFDNYNLWRAHFGESFLETASTNVATVPEPATLGPGLVMLCYGGLAMRSRKNLRATRTNQYGFMRHVGVTYA